MLKEIIIAVLVGFVVFEIIEHLVLPLIWLLIKRKRRSICDVSSMVGKVCEVKHWKDLKGKICINGEIWNARSELPLLQGDRAVIERMEGFLLTVKKVPTVSDPNKDEPELRQN